MFNPKGKGSAEKGQVKATGKLEGRLGLGLCQMTAAGQWLQR